MLVMLHRLSEIFRLVQQILKIRDITSIDMQFFQARIFTSYFFKILFIFDNLFIPIIFSRLLLGRRRLTAFNQMRESWQNQFLTSFLLNWNLLRYFEILLVGLDLRVIFGVKSWFSRLLPCRIIPRLRLHEHYVQLELE